MNRLTNQRVYLAGAMDRVPDRGMEWRDYITPFLQELNVTVFNPLKKTGSVGLEDDTTHKLKRALKISKKYDDLSNLMKSIRSVDLRLVDISDFMIVHLDIDTHPCGTLEEIFLANRQKKPIIIHIQQGKQQCPDWLFGSMPHSLFFDDWHQIIDYLHHIDKDQHIDTLNRWYFIHD